MILTRDQAEKTDAVLKFTLAFLLPFGFMLPVIIALIFINRLLFSPFSFKENRFPFFVLVTYYFIHLAGMIWTKNMSAGWFDLQVKLSFLVIPIVFQLKSTNDQFMSRTMFWFLAGCLAASFTCLFNATWTLFSEGENRFFYIPFSVFLHPAYSSMYNNLSLSFLLLSFLSEGFSLSRFLRIMLIALLVIFNVLYSSKAGLLVMFLLLLLFFLLLAQKKKKMLILVLGEMGLALSGCALYYTVPEVHDRVHTIITSLTESNPDKSSSESTAVRILVWKSAATLVRESPVYGYGTGDGKDVLLEQYQKDGLTGAYEHNLGAHNQFLQSLLTTGLPGLCSLLLIIVFLFYRSFKNKDYLLLFFALNTALNFMTESALETQAGVIFFAFFCSLFFFSESKSNTLSVQ